MFSLMGYFGKCLAIIILKIFLFVTRSSNRFDLYHRNAHIVA